MKPEVDPALLDCAEAPDPPAIGATQRDVAEYVVTLYDAGSDCRRKLSAVRRVLLPSP